MKFSSHSLGKREAERPIRGQSFRTMRLTGNSSCNTTPHKFGVVNLVAQHNKAAHQKLSSDGHFRFWLITTMPQPLVEPLQLRIATRGGLARLVKQKAQQFRTGFTNTAHPAPLRRAIFHAIKTRVSRGLARSTEA